MRKYSRTKVVASRRKPRDQQALRRVAQQYINDPGYELPVPARKIRVAQNRKFSSPLRSTPGSDNSTPKESTVDQENMTQSIKAILRTVPTTDKSTTNYSTVDLQSKEQTIMHVMRRMPEIDNSTRNESTVGLKNKKHPPIMPAVPEIKNNNSTRMRYHRKRFRHLLLMIRGGRQ